MTSVAGVDGCKAGWVAVISSQPDAFRAEVFETFLDVIDSLPADAVIAVDMPIGLPERIGKGGRGPEALIRPLLGERQSSVFSIPSRTAVYAEQGPFTSEDERYAAHLRASEVALATSEPPRKISIQAFGIFHKIREIDRLLTDRPELRSRVIESHPELAFASLNGGQPMRLPKKIRSAVNPAGMAERRALLARHGLPVDFLAQRAPKGAAADDFLDACAMVAIARLHAQGRTISYPQPPLADGAGNPIAIWAAPIAGASESRYVKPMAHLPQNLLNGYREFMAGRYEAERSHYRALAKEGQAPETLMIACCDSRAAPELIFNAAPGELFVIRNVANLVPPYSPDGEFHSTSAALEFAVQALKVKNIVVMGHGRCGGIKAALDPNATPLSPGDFIGKWMSMVAPVAETVSQSTMLTASERQTALERISIRFSIANLRTFPCVSILEGKGRLTLHGAWFDISTGELWVMDPATGDFSRPEFD